MAGKRKAASPESPESAPTWSQRLALALAAFRAALVHLGSRLLTHFLLPILLPIAVVVLGLIGLQALQSALRDGSGPLPIVFADIDCPAPPGMIRRDFLDNVQAYANLPDQIDLLDPASLPRLTAAFASSPWVERVDRITPMPEGLRIELTFRIPVLAAPVEDRFRAVDGRAVLLPERATRPDLPRFDGRIDVPPVRPGSVWPDPRLTAAASVIAWLGPHQDRLRIDKVGADERGRGVLLRTAFGRIIIWGSPPGAELTGERSAEEKLDRLLRALAESGPPELDLRQ